ncbi:hypothetical protein BC793_124102 [Actinoplanes xinjiangensis]|uniref:Uncharacterized protein n=1 Tax=Actinoplanes xinjiangensis TaxID=512350 RepID=A0A316EUX5_9ACTN|nr:hypothetical protein BC793_124102 [Actinoplanes xinjiangensis]
MKTSRWLAERGALARRRSGSTILTVAAPIR